MQSLFILSIIASQALQCLAIPAPQNSPSVVLDPLPPTRNPTPDADTPTATPTYTYPDSYSNTSSYSFSSIHPHTSSYSYSYSYTTTPTITSTGTIAFYEESTSTLSSEYSYPTETFTPEPSDDTELTCLRNYSGCLEAHGGFNVVACETEALMCLDAVPGEGLR